MFLAPYRKRVNPLFAKRTFLDFATPDVAINHNHCRVQ